MSNLFDDEKNNVIEEDEFVEVDEAILDDLDKQDHTPLDARRQLENILEDKRLREELDDFLDY